MSAQRLNTEILVTFTRPRRRVVRRCAGRRGARLRCVTARPYLLEKREALSRQLGAMLFNQALRGVFSSQARAEALHIFATGCPQGPALPRGRLSALSTCRFTPPGEEEEGAGALGCVALRRSFASLKKAIHSADSWARCSLKHFAASFPAKPGQRLCISLPQAVRMAPPAPAPTVRPEHSLFQALRPTGRQSLRRRMPN